MPRKRKYEQKYKFIPTAIATSGLLTTGKASELLNCSFPTVYKLIKAGLLPCFRSDQGWYLFRAEDVEAAKKYLVLTVNKAGDRYTLPRTERFEVKFRVTDAELNTLKRLAWKRQQSVPQFVKKIVAKFVQKMS